MERGAVEVDGEFCVPHEDGEVRHHIDLGPILGDVSRPGIYFLGKALCSSRRCSCSSLPSS